MKSIPRAGALSMLVSGVLFSAYGFYVHWQKPTLVPMVTHVILKGGKITRQDIQYRQWRAKRKTLAVGGYARMNLLPGEVLTTVMQSRQAAHPNVVLSLPPGNSLSIKNPAPGSWINILVISKRHAIWQTHAVQVVGSATGSSLLGGGSSGSINVAMPAALAMLLMVKAMTGTMVVEGVGS